MKWQPIETAPKDGSLLLTLKRDGAIRIGAWYNNPFGYADTVIDDISGKWWTATHWMPLPDPPAE